MRRRHISKSYVGRSNLSIRVALRKFTLDERLPEEIGQLKAACALYFAYYNFTASIKPLRVSPGARSWHYRSHMDAARVAPPLCAKLVNGHDQKSCYRHFTQGTYG